jgi:hypothetical protein
MGIGFDVDQDVGDTSIYASDYEIGFYLFLALACGVGIITAVALGCGWFGNRKTWFYESANGDGETSSRKTKMIQVSLLVLLGVGVALVAWGSFALTDSGHMQDSATAPKGSICIMFGATAILFSYPCCVYGLRGDVRMNILMATTYFLVIPGWILLSISFKQLSLTAEYELMTMNTTNIRAQYDNAMELCFAGKLCTGYRGQIKVSWAPEEYCADVSPELSCTAWITDPSCDRYTFDGKDLVGDEVSASESATKCIKERYDHMAFAEELQTEQVTDQVQSSSNAPRMVDAYGSCSCMAVFDTSEDLVAVFKTIGLGMSIAGICVLLFVGLQYHGQRKRKVNTEKGGPDPELVDTCSSSASEEGVFPDRKGSSIPTNIILREQGEERDSSPSGADGRGESLPAEALVYDTEEAATSSLSVQSTGGKVQNALVGLADAGSDELEDGLVWVGNYLLDSIAKFRRGGTR